MKDGWKIKKLGDLATYINGYPFKPTEWADEGLPIIRIQNLNSAKDEFHYCNSPIPSKYLVHNGDILISWSASLGVYTWEKGNAYLNQHIFRVAFDKEPINKRFFQYAVSHKLEEMRKLVHGATMQHITKGKFDGIDVPIPLISEQQRIADILDEEFEKIDRLRSNAELNLQNAKDLFRKSLAELLSPKHQWAKSTLKELCSKIGSGATPLGGKKSYGKTGINLIRSLNVFYNEFRYEDLAHINKEQASLLSNVEIQRKDVLFNITGASVSRCCMVPDNVIPARVNQHVSILRVNPNILVPSLLVYTMISPQHNSALMRMAEKGATRQAITKAELEGWTIQYPKNLDEQTRIVATLDELDAKCKVLQDNYTKTMALCDDLKQALLRKAFSGEI